MARAFHAKSIRYPGFIPLLLAWTLFGCIAYMRYRLLIDTSSRLILPGLIEWLGSFYPWVVMAPLVFRLEKKFPLNRSMWLLHLLWLALACVPLIFLAREISVVLKAIMLAAFHQPPSEPIFWWPVPRCELAMQLGLYCVTVGGGCIIRNFMERQEDERRGARLALYNSELESNLRRAELEVLRMRLNPHFLFNSLQNISTLTRQDPDTASRMLVRLGELLRAILHKETQAETTLAEEIELTKAYVAVEQMRFRDQLSVLFDVEPGLEPALVPSFLLQPLVENAMKHGMRGVHRTGIIWIRGNRHSDQLALTVSDNGCGLSEEKLTNIETGVGLGSTSGRLERMYPDQHSLSIQQLPEGGTEVRILLPLHWKDQFSETSAHGLATTAHR
jgi:two-component sensor histidine kinase